MQNDRLIQLTYSEDEDIVDREDFTVKRPNVRQSPSRRSVRVRDYVRAYVYSRVKLCTYVCTCVRTYVHMCYVCQFVYHGVNHLRVNHF